MLATKKYRIGQYVGVKMGGGKWNLNRIIQIYEPGKSGPFCKQETYTEVYTNHNSYTTFWLSWGGISVPEIIFNSKKDADLWFLKKEISHLKPELKIAKARSVKSAHRLHAFRKAIRKIV